ncbi:helix-turn-helix domain-containing protein [Aquabacterium sp. A7-Y]|uniref:MerR family transcriptional regulator n=1 Tax=Aquabacterium sp. A7-Y TaxID=1349605 RepID=UPI00223D7557|nr:helix-turn-helix domain-containing protein [Aquabacterium sp. A7-Y]MCW7536798.1 helix-turn-helix domain-containing protein [Aquabacterium sp. A7-Y]
MKISEHDGQVTIGVLAERTGVNVPTIRYYEEIGLIPPARRRPSGHRVYDTAAHELLTFIRSCRDFGFSVEQVRALVSLTTSTERDCVEARDIAQRHLDEVRNKLTELRALERSLSRFVTSCNTECAGGPAARCTIFKDLGRAVVATSASPSCCG